MTRLPIVFSFILILAACTLPSGSTRLWVATPQPTIAATPQSAAGVPAIVEANGKLFILRCFGEGEPSVILENGYGVGWTEWTEVITGIQDQTRICAYDRTTPAKTSSEAADDLHTMLKSAGLTPPFILAGHSLGGFTVILYASRHPEEVAGVALIDSSHPDQDARALAVLPTPSPADTQGLKNLRGNLGATMLGSFDWKASTDQVRAVTSLGAIPLAVVEASPDNILPNIDIGGDDLEKQLIAVRQALQADLDLLSTNSTHFTSDYSGHMVPEEDPRLVIEALISLLQNRSAD